MLGLIDTLHRHGLQHLVEVLQRQVPALFEQAQEDQAVRMLLILYDLMPSEQLEAPAPVPSGSFIPLQQIDVAVRKIKHPVFTSVSPLETLPPGTMKGVEAGGIRILLCNLDGDIYAYRNACAGSILPLDVGQLEGHTLLCPWHNCRYDVRTGKRLDGDSSRLTVVPVAIRDGMIQLALNVESTTLRVPQLPTKPSGR